jgi:hypothetical protein
MIWLLALVLQGQDQKLPVPDAADQRKAEAEIRSVFKEDFVKKTRDGKRAFAARLLAEAADAKNTPTSRYVVLLLSRDLAVEALDVGTILASIDQLGKLYEVTKPLLTGATFSSSSNALKVSAFNNAQKFATSPEDASLLGDAYLKVAEDTLKEKLFDDALSSAQAAEKYAKAAKASSALERAVQLTKEIPELKKEEDLFGTAITTKADDPTAKLVKGRYSLFVVGDDKAGIDHLLGCSDEGLKSVAKLEAAKPMTAEAMAEVAEAWFALSKKEEILLQKRRYKNRARSWFDDAMKNAGGIARTKIEKRLAEFETGGQTGTVLDLLKLINPKDAVRGDWTLSDQTLALPKSEYARIPIPYAPGESEYDLTIVLQHTDGKSHFVIGLAYGKRQFTAELDGTGTDDVSGFATLDGKGYNSNETTHKGRVLDAQAPSTITCAVRRTGVVVTVDGRAALQYKGDYSRLSLTSTWDMPNKETLFIGAWNARWSISKITLRQVSGKGKTLR